MFILCFCSGSVFITGRILIDYAANKFRGFAILSELRGRIDYASKVNKDPLHIHL